nr:BTB/POZ domain-containing protein POB1-like isoform X1 [Ipomoea trifida]GMC67428.1 BTB/POZ domain-containing protein POB1-like isoform X1 [Ipomoea batatas]GMD64934.1 BTB/POZ domain-containing protein POB1-like isoform X1 [Ipomoea batatas]GME02985.1 BTB/POZ domain-containing protein POB1-like isoform X1 [Ipomoea batatas]GME17203.1 BTB/POZ domain-containing protein POB1-like isoform X1 [Ipomoea batatas]
MKDRNLDLFDPRTAVMDPDYSPTTTRQPDFAFAFNDSNFSDRLLRIEIVADSSDQLSDSEGCQSLADWARHRKRRKEDTKNENDMCHSFAALDITVCPEEQILTCHQIDPDDVDTENQDESVVAMIEEVQSGDEAPNSEDSDWNMDSRVTKVKTLHISSPILAAKSPFFYKLFSNGMKESEQRQVTLQIHASEEAALMELLNFMYSNSLTTTSAPALLDILMAADKFEVASCMRYCSRQLRNLPMTPESALLYLELPSSVLMAEAVQPLTDAAKQFLAARYKDVSKFQEEVMNLPLAGIEAILSSDDLQVASEDAVYDLVLKWTRSHYPKLEDRHEILGSRLGRYIRFPYMSCRKLRKILVCNDFDHEFASKHVLDALFFKAEAPHRQRTQAAEGSTSASRRFVERAYKYRPIKVVEFEVPRQQCIVYLDLKREECANLFPSGRVYSQAFHLGGQGFFLSAHCNMDQQSSFHCFGLFLGMQEKGSVSFAVDYEFAARSKPTEEYISKYKGNYTFTGGKAVGYRNLFGVQWTSFMADDSPYFINGILHLRAELTIRH